MDRADIFAPDFRATPYWWDEAEPSTSEEGNLPAKVDVCIVGGGYTGLSCAIELARNGTSCLVFDAWRIGEGASSRNGGLVTPAVKLATSSYAAGLGTEGQKKLAEEAVGTFGFLASLIEREDIDCDFAKVGRFSCAYSSKHYDDMARSTETAARLTGAAAYMVPRARQREEIGSDYYYGGQVLEEAATVHPAKLLKGLAAAAAAGGAQLVGNCRVIGLDRAADGWKVSTEFGEVRADNVLLATNGYTPVETPWFRRRVVPVASFMIATEELPEDLARELLPNARAVADTRRVLNYFRLSPDGQRVLWGGRVGVKSMDAHESGRRLHSVMTQIWPQLRDVRITNSWNGNVGFTFDYMPHLGSLDGIHYALGCQGSGVAMQSWLGFQSARSMLCGGTSNSAFANLPFPTKPFYRGDPWFLPTILAWYRLRDLFDRRERFAKRRRPVSYLEFTW